MFQLFLFILLLSLSLCVSLYPLFFLFSFKFTMYVDVSIPTRINDYVSLLYCCFTYSSNGEKTTTQKCKSNSNNANNVQQNTLPFGERCQIILALNSLLYICVYSPTSCNHFVRTYTPSIKFSIENPFSMFGHDIKMALLRAFWLLVHAQILLVAIVLYPMKS